MLELIRKGRKLEPSACLAALADSTNVCPHGIRASACRARRFRSSQHVLYREACNTSAQNDCESSLLHVYYGFEREARPCAGGTASRKTPLDVPVHCAQVLYVGQALDLVLDQAGVEGRHVSRCTRHDLREKMVCNIHLWWGVFAAQEAFQQWSRTSKGRKRRRCRLTMSIRACSVRL